MAAPGLAMIKPSRVSLFTEPISPLPSVSQDLQKNIRPALSSSSSAGEDETEFIREQHAVDGAATTLFSLSLYLSALLTLVRI
jgi:hypothetical protein